MPDIQPSLDDLQVSGRRLLLLKRIAEALEADFLTLEEAKSAAVRISPHFRTVFDAPGTMDLRAARIVQAIEITLQRRFPGRFRADETER
jgi:hypothetical protein